MQSAITSRDNERVKYACHVAESAAFRAAEGLLFAEGRRLCLDLAQSLRCAMVFVTQPCLAALGPDAPLVQDALIVADSVAQKLACAQSPQGLFCLFETPRAALADADAGKGVLVCERLQDPANVGAILRSAAGLGFGGAVLAEGCADPFSPKALRAGMGAQAHLPVVCGQSLSAAAAFLKDKGAMLLAAALQDAVPLAAAGAKPPFALLVGNEGAGLSAQALAAADKRVCIPMQNGVESLNAAAAAAVMMYALKNT